MKKASFLIASLFLVLAGLVEAKDPPIPIGYFKHGDFFCQSDPHFEKPESAFGRKFCEPQIIGCQANGGKFCSAGTRDVCCPADNACGLGTALGFEVAVCVPPLVCDAKSPNYAGRTQGKNGKNVCCLADQEPGPHRTGVNAPYCQPKSQSTCASGEQFIQGTGDNNEDKRCCPINTIPTLHLNGLPFCARSPLTVLTPNGGEQIAKSSSLYQIKWKTNGIPATQLIKFRLINSQGVVVDEYNHLNNGVDNFVPSEAKYPPGQYKIELSATIRGETISDQSDNFFTLFEAEPEPEPEPPPRNPPSPADTTPPTATLKYKRFPNGGADLTLEARDPSGINEALIILTPLGSTVSQSLSKSCEPRSHTGAVSICTLGVPANRWTLGAQVVFAVNDNSPNRNLALNGYEIVRGDTCSGLCLGEYPQVIKARYF